MINVTKACSGNISSTTVNNILPICKSHNLAPIDTNQFIGLWDLNKLMEKYGHHVKFNMLSFNEFDDDYGNSYLDNILKNFKYTKEQQKKNTKTIILQLLLLIGVEAEVIVSMIGKIVNQ